MNTLMDSHINIIGSFPVRGIPGMFCLIICLLLGTAAYPAGPAEQGVYWRGLATGLELSEFPLSGDSDETAKITVLRIDPALFSFHLYTSSATGAPPRTLRDWAHCNNAVAVINASMYLPDYQTSTAYLRQDDHINNPRIASRYQSIFLAEPRTPDGSLPLARICDKSSADCGREIPLYRTAVQNIRIITSRRDIVWHTSGRKTAISAVAEDGRGRILFLHAQDPVAVRDFAERLLALPLDIHATMYTEGGVQAGLYLETPELSHFWSGRHVSSFFPPVQLQIPVPNVLAITPRTPAETVTPPRN